jgi:glycosidase
MPILQNDIIYFILTDRFYGVENPEFAHLINKTDPNKYHGGNFNGIAEKIPYLKKLGITALWITPVYMQLDLKDKDGYHGYWALDFDRVNPILYIDNGKYQAGSKLYLKDLVDKLHDHGIKLILDIVVNHTGYDHPAFLGHNGPSQIQKHWFNHPDLSSEQNQIKGQLCDLPDFNLDLPDVCDFHVLSVTKWLKETGIDGVRMDTVKHVEGNFWNYYKTQVISRFPQVSLIGEVFVYDSHELASYQKNWAFDGLFDFPLQDAIKAVFIESKPMTLLHSPFNTGTGVLENDRLFTNHNKLVTFLDNHDLSARFFTSMLECHSSNVDISCKLMKLALTFLFTIRGIPQIYYGTEIAMEGHHDPDNRRDFLWDVFSDVYEVQPEFGYRKEIFEHCRAMIAIRKQNPALTSGMFICLYVDQWAMVYLRYVEYNVVLVAINNGWQHTNGPLYVELEKNPFLPQRIKDLMTQKNMKPCISNHPLQIENGKFKLILPAKTAEVFTHFV